MIISSKMILLKEYKIKINISLIKKILYNFKKNIKIKFGPLLKTIHSLPIRLWFMVDIRKKKMKISSDLYTFHKFVNK
jgi:hypothetical protein